MKRFVIHTLLAIGWLGGMAGCQTSNSTRLPIDQVPMYGGMDRQAVPALRDGDARFIEGVTREFGSREAAAKAWVDYGFKKHLADDSVTAMKRFNQAWLLDSNNPEVYWGFAAVLWDRGEACEAVAYIEKAMTMGLTDASFLADAGMTFAGCVTGADARAGQVADLTKKEAYLKKSAELFQRASAANPKLAYVPIKWAIALAGAGQYADAWKKVAEARALGGNPSPTFLNKLQAKMAEPK